MHRSTQQNKAPTFISSKSKENEATDDDDKKVDEWIEEAYAIEAAESNLREKFAEVGGFEVDDTDEHRQGFAIPSTSEEIADAGRRWGAESWQINLLKTINSDFVQRLLVALLVLDVMVLFVELGEFINYRIHSNADV